MKLNSTKLIPIYYACAALLLGASAQAANVTKLDSTDMSAATGWSAVPAATDIGEFNATPSAGNLASLTLNGANLTLGGLQLDAGLQGPLTIALGNTLNLGPSTAGLPGIDMSLANQDLTINCLVGVTPVGASEAWLVPSGRTLTLGTNISVTAAKQLNITNSGSIIANGTSFGFGNVGASSGIVLAGSGSFMAPNATVTVQSSQTTSTAPTATAPVAAATTIGFVVAGESASLSQVKIGTGNSGCSMLVSSGSLTCSGPALIGNSSSTSRPTYAQVSGGTFTVNDTTTGLLLSRANTTACISELYVSGGTANIGKISYGYNGDTSVGGTGWVIVGTSGSTSGSLYIGSGGIQLSNTSGSYSVNCSLYGGTLGASADWTASSKIPIQLSAPAASPFIIRAADAGGAAHNITLNGPVFGVGSLTKIGNGSLILAGTNTYTGTTLVNAGALVGVTGGSISNTVAIVVAAGATAGVQLASANGQFVATNLVATNASFMDFDFNNVAPSLTTAPMKVLGDLNITNTVGFTFRNGTLAVGTYPLITYTGNLVGTVTNRPFGLLPGRSTGFISNDVATTKTIYLVVTNGSSWPLHWAVGNGNWDVGISANWQDANSVATTYQEAFGVGDQVLLDDRATVSSPAVNLTTNVSPSSLTISNSAKAYTISGSGSIGGSIALTKNGNGTLTLANSNSFSGGINLNGGTTVFSTRNNLGAGAINFGGGTLKFGSGNTEDISVRTVNLNAGGGTIDDNGQTINFANPIGNSGVGGLTKAGSGILTLAGTNKYTGNTVVANGTLALGATTYISNSPAIIVNGGATLDAVTSGVNLALGSAASQVLAGTGTVNGNVTAGAGTKITSATNGVYGTLNLGNDLTISGASLAFDVSTTNHDVINVAGNLNISSGSLLVITNSTALTNGVYKLIQYSGALSSGAGSAANLAIQGFSQAGKVAQLSDATANEIDLIVTSAGAASLVWQGNDGTLPNNWDIGTTANFTNNSGSASVFSQGDNPAFNDTSANPNVSLMAALQPGSVTVNANANNYVFSDGTGVGTGFLTGSGGITKNGSSTLTIATANNNTGPTVINGGTLQVGNGGALGDLGGGNVTNNAALVFNQSGAHSVSGVISGTGSLTQQGAGTVTLAANNPYTGPTIISSGILVVGAGGAAGVMTTSGITNNGQLTLNSTTDWNYNMPDTGTGAFRQIGTNTITMSGVNTRTGETRADSGKLKLGNTNQLQGSVRLEGTGILDMNGRNQFIPGLTSGSATAKIVNDAGTATNLLTLSSDSSGSVLAQVLDNEGTGGAISVLKLGTGELYWRGNNTYSGGTEIRDGRIRANETSIFGTGPVNLTGGGISFTGGSQTNTINALPIAGLTTNYLRCAGNITFVDPVAGGSTSDLIVNIAPGTSSSLTFRQAGGATQWAGMTGTVYLRSEDATKGGFFRADGAINLSGATVDMNDSQVTFNCNGSQSVQIGALVGNTSTAVLNPSSGSTFTIGAKNLSTAFAGAITGAGNLVKVGSGTLTLSGANSATGSMTVSNSTLVLTVDAAPVSNNVVKVVSGATLNVSGLAGSTLSVGPDVVAQTLTGSGTVTGNVLVGTNGTVNPGDGIGALTVTGNLTLGGKLVMELNTTNTPATNDTLVVSGTLTVGGTLTVTNLGPALQGGNTFKLFSTGVTGFTATNLPALTGVKYWTNNLAVNGTISVVDPINTNPPQMQVSVSGSNLTLAWPTNAGWILQSNSVGLASSGSWFNYPANGSVTVTNVTVSMDPSKTNVFFRMLKP